MRKWRKFVNSKIEVVPLRPRRHLHDSKLWAQNEIKKCIMMVRYLGDGNDGNYRNYVFLIKQWLGLSFSCPLSDVFRSTTDNNAQLLGEKQIFCLFCQIKMDKTYQKCFNIQTLVDK